MRGVRLVLLRKMAIVLWLALTAVGQAPPHPQAPTATIGPASHIQPPPATYHFPDGSEQKVTGTADSAGFVALLYRVHDRFEAWFDPRTLCSLRISKRTEEGFRKRETSIRFDYAKRKSILDETNLKNNEKKHTEEDIPGCVTDVLSGLYYLGSLPLQPGSTYTFPLNDGGKTVDVKVHVEGREQVKTDAGTFNTVRVQPEASAGLLKDRGHVWIWYSDDAQRIPVQMRARMFWGTLTFKLQRVEK